MMNDRAQLMRLKRIQNLYLKVRRMLAGKKIGDHRSRRVGFGLEFDQLRDYRVGDNVRCIDWKSSARSNKLIVRSYYESHNRTIVLLVDISTSTSLSSTSSRKTDLIRDLAIIMSCAAEVEQDHVGLMLFHKGVETVIPARMGRKHTAILAETLLAATLVSGGTCLAQVSAECLQRFDKNVLVILISDCISSGYETALAQLARKNDVVVLRVTDHAEVDLPQALRVVLQDPETDQLVDGTSGAQMRAVRDFLAAFRKEQDQLFKQWGIDCFDITVGVPYEQTLVRFFNERH